jgi:hypothetical protein
MALFYLLCVSGQSGADFARFTARLVAEKTWLDTNANHRGLKPGLIFEAFTRG